MSFKSTLRIAAHYSPFTLVVEPWADEFAISSGEECKLVAIHPSVIPTFGLSICRDGDLEICVIESGSTYELWRGGSREFQMPVPVPGLPPASGNSDFWDNAEDDEDWNNA